MGTEVYSFDSVIVTLGGVEITGWSDGDDSIKVTPNQDKTTKIVGNDRSVIFNKSVDDSGEIELKLMTTSDSNADLNDIFNAYNDHDLLFEDGILIRDFSGNTLWHADNLVVKNLPVSDRGAVSGFQTWVLSVDILTANYDEA